MIYEALHLTSFTILVAYFAVSTYGRALRIWRRRYRGKKADAPTTCEDAPTKAAVPEPVPRPRRRSRRRALDALSCVVCLDRQREIAFPCFHFCACSECGNALKECPICRAPAPTRLRLYL